jgi:hypothetical protein
LCSFCFDFLAGSLENPAALSIPIFLSLRY